MPYQTGRNAYTAFKEETTFGQVPVDLTNADILRFNSGKLSLKKEPINSNENRRDGQRTRGRHGSRSIDGSYPCDLAIGAFDKLIQAVLRGTFDTPLALTGLSVTPDATGKTYTRSTGSWITDGVRVGDVVRFGGFTAGAAANNSRNLRVVALTATVMTVAETPTTSTQQTAITMSRPKKVLNGTNSRSFTVEQYEGDIDSSEIFKGVRVTGCQLQLQPNSMATITFTLMGQDKEDRTGAQAPMFTNPVATSTLGLTAVEAVIRLGSVDVLDVQSVNLNMTLGGQASPVSGSSITPDIFTNQMTVEGSITALRKDLALSTSFLNEDQLSLHLLFTQNESEPKAFCSFVVPNLTLSGVDPSDLGSDGPRTQEISLLIGADDRGGAYAPTTVAFQTT